MLMYVYAWAEVGLARNTAIPNTQCNKAKMLYLTQLLPIDKNNNTAYFVVCFNLDIGSEISADFEV